MAEMSIPLDLEAARTDEHAVVRVAGELDVGNHAEFKVALFGLISDGVTDITVDAARLTFIGSEGIGVLVGAVARGAFVEVANAPPLVLRALEISGVDQVVAVTPAS